MIIEKLVKIGKKQLLLFNKRIDGDVTCFLNDEVIIIKLEEAELILSIIKKMNNNKKEIPQICEICNSNIIETTVGEFKTFNCEKCFKIYGYEKINTKQEKKKTEKVKTEKVKIIENKPYIKPIGKIAIIDADLLSRDYHRFPNLALMKISGYYKKLNYETILIKNWDEINESTMFSIKYDMYFMAKVFTDTIVPDFAIKIDKMKYGGTGFFFDNATPLEPEIEHSYPDYDLYNEYVKLAVKNGQKKSDYKFYTDYSIGFLTRGCFRQCEFCVNKNFTKVVKNSPIEEFYNEDKKVILFLDDNFLGIGDKYSEEVISKLIEINKPFVFKQGLDIRLMTEKRAKLFDSCKYDGDYIFAFDNIADKDKIESKLTIWRQHSPTSSTKLYVLCGFDRKEKFNKYFWANDIRDTFERISILMKYNCLPYIMKFNKYEEAPSPYMQMYKIISGWCNAPAVFKKASFRQNCISSVEQSKIISEFEKKHPDIASKYFDLSYEKIKKYNDGQMSLFE